MLLITGDRDWGLTGRPREWEVLDYIDHVWLTHEVLSEMHQHLLACELEPILLHGACPTGADEICDYLGEQIGFQIVRVPAKWKVYGRGAGPKRNQEMVDMAPAYVVAFHDDLERSKGTRSCVRLAEKAGIEVLKISA